MTERIPLTMDVDTGIDDSMAIALAVLCPGIDLLGISTVAGNVGVAHTTENTLRVLDWLGATDVPVYRGMSAPLSRALVDAGHFHGAKGLGWFEPPPARRGISEMTAPEFIVRTARERPGAVTMVFVGPLTNLAVALSLEPKLPELVPNVVIMGGAFKVPGNVTPAAEFNIFADPEAADAVCASGLPLTWIGLDVTHQVQLLRGDWDALEHDNRPQAVLIRKVCDMHFTGRNALGVHLHDPLALAVATDGSLVSCEMSALEVVTGQSDLAGQTRLLSGSSRPKHRVALGVERDAFFRFWSETLDLGAASSTLTT